MTGYMITAARPAGYGTLASGTTSTAAMISCCAHYLVNVAPVLGATGLVTFATQSPRHASGSRRSRAEP